MVLTTVQKKGASVQQLKIDGITDEFCRLTKTGDALAKFDAVVQGDMNDYRVQEVDVNKNVPAAAVAAKAEALKSGGGGGSGATRKRASAAGGGAAPKKRRSAKPKK